MATRDEYVAAIKSAFVTVAAKAVEGILIGYLPFLGTPGCAQILDLAVKKILRDLSNKAEVEAFFVYTDFRVTAEGNAFSQAAVANHRAQLSGTAEEKAKAQAELWAKFVPFAKVTA